MGCFFLFSVFFFGGGGVKPFTASLHPLLLEHHVATLHCAVLANSTAPQLCLCDEGAINVEEGTQQKQESGVS